MSNASNRRPNKCKNSYKLLDDYTVVDIETTGSNVNDCKLIEVAAVRIRNGKVEDTYSSLVKPDCKIPIFIEFLTGITNDMLKDAPLPDKVLSEFTAFLGNDFVVGHNIVSFDSCVLYDYLRDVLGIFFTNQMVDTLHFARKCDVNPDNYKLKTLADYFGITYDPHRAMNDCIANYQIYEKLKPLFDESRITKDASSEKHIKKVLSESTMALAELSGMCRSLTASKTISDEQVLSLQKWISENLYLAGNYPFDSIFEKLEEINKGGDITQEIRKELLSLLQIHSDPVKNKSDDSDADLTGKTVCLTGEFLFGSRDAVTEALKIRGVTVSGSVTSKTDYLIVGGEGSTAWACGNYGSKVKKALELQDKGKSIKIIREDVFEKWLNMTR